MPPRGTREAYDQPFSFLWVRSQWEPEGPGPSGVGCEGVGQAGGGVAALLYAWVFCRWFLYIVFVFLLGAICTREALRYDFLIAEKVSGSCTRGALSARSSVCSHLQMAACPLPFCLGIHVVLGPGQKDGGKTTEKVQALLMDP